MIKGTMEWSSKCVTIEDGLIRLFGPPPECDEIDRIDLARGELTVSKKVVEGKDVGKDVGQVGATVRRVLGTGLSDGYGVSSGAGDVGVSDGA